MKRVSTLCLTILFGTSLVYSQQGTTPSPQKILTRMVSVYGSCSSYADKGEVKTTFLKDGGPSTKYRPFTTAFVRPSQFRFEFEESVFENQTRHYIVWRDGYAVKSWWTARPKTRGFESLWLALAEAAGISGGSSINVPSMLMSDLKDSRRIQTLTQLALKGEEQLGKRRAYRIEGRDWRDNLLTLWIDKESYLLLKMYDKVKLKDVEAESTTTYQPQMNIKIEPKQLAFNH